MKIIYPNEGGIAVIHPTGELSVEEVARKDVPYGLPFLLVAPEGIPADRTFRNAWEADFSSPDGYGIGAQRWFIEQAQAELVEIARRVPPTAPEPTQPDALIIPTLAELIAQVDTTGMTDEQIQVDYAKFVASRTASHAQYVAIVEEVNASVADRHQQEVEAFEQRVVADTDRCNALIARMKAEVLKIEGVTL